MAGSEKATSDKDRTREGKYINTSLLTLGTVIGTLAENATKSGKGKADHVPFRNSKVVPPVNLAMKIDLTCPCSSQECFSRLCPATQESRLYARSIQTLARLPNQQVPYFSRNVLSAYRRVFKHQFGHKISDSHDDS